jgi:hypothetical protein
MIGYLKAKLMRTLSGLISAVESLNLNNIILESMDQASPTYLEQQKEQMSYAVNEKGQTIGKYRSAAYARKKNQMNPNAGYGNVDLKLTGSFYEAMEAKAQPEGMNINSTDQKSQMLQQKYGSDIFGLFGEWKEPFVEKLQTAVTELLTEQLNA